MAVGWAYCDRGAQKGLILAGLLKKKISVDTMSVHTLWFISALLSVVDSSKKKKHKSDEECQHTRKGE